MLIESLIYIVKCIYLILPGAFANMAPILVKNHFKFLAYPIDFNKEFLGKPLLGANKTFRGLIFGILASIIIVIIQIFLYKFPIFKSISFVDYDSINFLLFGFLMGFGALFGDLVKSFFKRRANIEPGKPFIPWDQIDSVLSGLVFLLPVFRPTVIMFFSTLVIAFIMHISIRTIGYYTGINKDRW